MNNYDLVIIGAGPTGLFATFLAGLRDINSITLEALDYTGGQIPELYPEKMVYDVQGIPKINAMELRDKMYEQAKLFDGETKIILTHLSEKKQHTRYRPAYRKIPSSKQGQEV